MDPERLLARLAAQPARAAVLLDVDGTIAPIVARPEDARVPAETRAELERIARSYALLGFVSGRAGEEARRIVGVEGGRYVGAHGLEGEPEAEAWRERLREFVETIAWPVEDKGLTVSFHYRAEPDRAAARSALEAVAERARKAGLVARFGRMVLELLPPVAASKGTAVRRLLHDHGLRRALYAGDDTTDLDAFRALDRLELAVRVAVASSEGPPALVEAADVTVPGPPELVELLRLL